MNGSGRRYTCMYILRILNSNYWMAIPHQNKAIWSQGVYRYWRSYFVFEGREEKFIWTLVVWILPRPASLSTSQGYFLPLGTHKEYLLPPVIPLAALQSNALRWPPINKVTGNPRRRRDTSGRDPRRRSPVAYEFLFSAHRTVLYRIAGNYRARRTNEVTIMLPPPSPQPIGSGDIVGDWTEAPSAFARSAPLGLGTCLLFLAGELSV